MRPTLPTIDVHSNNWCVRTVEGVIKSVILQLNKPINWIIFINVQSTHIRWLYMCTCI